MNLFDHSRTGPTLGALAAVAGLLFTGAACSSSGSGAAGTSGHTPAPSSGHSVPAAAFPVTVRDANGTVTIKQKPAAIVSLSPTATEMLFAIGAGDQVKAVDKNSDYPAEAPHSGLDSYRVNIEAVAGYRPDLVVASDLTAAQVKQLRTLGIPALVEPAAVKLADSYAQITELGRVTGHAAGAAALVAKMKKDIAAILQAAPKPTRPVPYYYELDQTYYSITDSTFIGRLLRPLGLTSIADSAKGAAASGGYPQLNAEFILNARPQYVFLADTRCCKQSVVTVGKRPGWSQLAALRQQRVVALDDDIASRWGPRVVDLLRTVATALRNHPVTGTS
jgi:iron complex transport system substrate-binding protein